MSPIVIGIDIGKDGALVALSRTLTPIVILRTTESFTMPTGKGSKRDYVESSMRAALLELRDGYDVRGVFVEKASVRPGEGVAGAMTVGQGEGLWRGIAVGLGLPLIRVSPTSWVAKVCRDAPGEGKERAIFVAGQRLPALPLIPPRCKKPHEGIADAACICLYAWEHHFENRGA